MRFKKWGKKVYCVDVGTNQLDETLRYNPNITLLENTDFRDIDGFTDYIDYYIMDVSFISITNILPNIKKLKGEKIITLIKPQFEAGKKNVNKGIVKDRKAHIEVLNNLISFINSLGYGVTKLCYSPIKGKSGNIEYLCFISNIQKSFDIRRLVEEAFNNLRGE